MAQRFSKKKIQQKTNPEKLEQAKSDREFHQILYDTAIEQAHDHYFITMIAVPLLVMQKEFDWSNEDLTWFADKIIDQYNHDIYSGRKKLSDYAKWVEKTTGMRFESEWL